MSLEEKLTLLGDLFEVDPSEISPETSLSTLDSWDSMTKLSLIVLMDDEFGKKLTGEQIRNFVFVSDILNFME